MLGLQDKSYVLAEENTAHHTLTDQKSETPEVTVKSILSKRVDDEVTHLADRIQDTFKWWRWKINARGSLCFCMLEDEPTTFSIYQL